MGKSARTAARIQRVALDLFAEHGYDDTTVAAIAEAAGVSQMTVFRHFPAKEDLVLDDPFDPVIAEAVAAQPAEWPVIDRVRRGLGCSIAALDPADDGVIRERVRVVSTTPSLRAGMWRNTTATQDVVAEALCRQGADPFAAQVAAACGIAALMAALVDWGRDPTPGPLRECLTAALDVLAGSPVVVPAPATDGPPT